MTRIGYTISSKMKQKLQSAILFVLIIIINLECLHSKCVSSPSVTVTSGTHSPQGEICPGDLIFEDNFENFNLKKWQHELTLNGGNNWEFQWYDNSRYNSFVENGILNIKPTLLADETGEEFLYSGNLDINGGAPADQCTNPVRWGCSRTGSREFILNPIKSARIRTVNSFSFRYGKVEVSAKMPAGDWLWPGIWLLPRYNQYSKWPISGEIDLVESRGNRDLRNVEGKHIGTQVVSSTLHWGLNDKTNRYLLTHWEKFSEKGFDTRFHKYQLEWTPDKLSFSVDDEQIGEVKPPQGGFWELGGLDSTGRENPWKRNSKMAPFDQEFYVVINLAVGGINYFPDNGRNPGGKPWKNDARAATTDFWRGKSQWLPTWQSGNNTANLQVDYVRICAV